jgi:hypothetical protein
VGNVAKKRVPRRKRKGRAAKEVGVQESGGTDVRTSRVRGRRRDPPLVEGKKG